MLISPFSVTPSAFPLIAKETQAPPETATLNLSKEKTLIPAPIGTVKYCE